VIVSDEIRPSALGCRRVSTRWIVDITAELPVAKSGHRLLL
jgi:hypothetical protein